MKFYLRIFVSVVSVVCCVLVVALWVRSYQTIDMLGIPVTSSWSIEMGSLQGVIGIGKSGATQTWAISHMPLKELQTLAKMTGHPMPSSLWGGFISEKNSTGVFIPCWVALLFAGAVGVAPWIYGRWRFSMRMLLAAMTVMAILLGLLVYVTRG